MPIRQEDQPGWEEGLFGALPALRERDKEIVQRHYDVGSLYELFLGDSMTIPAPTTSRRVGPRRLG